MRLKEITLKNFKNFEDEHTIKLYTLNLFFGENGSGKSAIILDSILFCLYGNSEGVLNELLTIGKKKSSVNLFLESHNKSYSITREIPSKLTILEDGIEIKGSIKVKQEFLNKIFHDLTWFKQFRLFDVSAGINILEGSSLDLQKTLLSFNEEKLNTLRTRLLALKRERDVYNVSNIEVLPHAPSEARKTVLVKGIELISKLLFPIKKQLSNQQNQLQELNRQLGGVEQQTKLYWNKAKNVSDLTICPTCYQEVKTSYKNQVTEEVTKLVEENNKAVAQISAEIVAKKKDCQDLIEKEATLQNHLRRAESSLAKLETRLKQKEYVWTPRDLEVIKECIKEVDNFYSFYLLEAIKSVEPVINHLLSKIKFELKFILNKKGKFDFIVIIDKKEFKYSQLSKGQKLVVSMAVKMALLLERGESGLIISDEGMSSLSNTNLDLMFELVQEHPFQLLAVVHRYENPPNFLKLFEVKKGTVQNVQDNG